MGWSGGTFTRSNGTYTGATVWATDEASSFDIESSRHDTHDQDLATGINSTLHKGGQNSPDGHLNWVNTEFGGTTGGTANAQTLALSNAPGSYYSNMVVRFKAGSGLTNTSNVTLNVNSLGAKALKDQYGNQLLAGQITAGFMYVAIYDGTDFIVLNPSSVEISFNGTWGGAGSLTYSISAESNFYYRDNNKVFWSVDAVGTIANSGSYITLTAPVNIDSITDSVIGSGRYRDASSGDIPGGAVATVGSSTEIRIFKGDGSSWTAGANRFVRIQGWYRPA